MNPKTLIERIEAAEAGSRELDVEIAEIALGRIVESLSPENSPVRILSVMPLTRSGAFELPHYTTSIDAALTLVPEGWRSRARLFRGKNRWDLEKAADQRNRTFGRGTTPALAICAAALRAKENDHG